MDWNRIKGRRPLLWLAGLGAGVVVGRTLISRLRGDDSAATPTRPPTTAGPEGVRDFGRTS